MQLDQVKNIFIVGIKGVAMANLALIFKKLGKNVSGSDVAEEFITDNLLKKNRIKFSPDFNAKDIPNNTDLLIYSAAHKGKENLQVKEAKKRGIKIAHQAEVIGALLDTSKNKIAVCGSHGKTTTSSLLSYCLIELGEKPSYLVGAPQFNQFWGGDYQERKYFVVEADEYGVNPPVDKTPKFHFLDPHQIICTNIDFDHPDVYQNINQTKQEFLKFFDDKKLILCADDPHTVQLINQLKRNKYQTFGYSNYADFQIRDQQFFENYSSFKLYWHKNSLGEFAIPLFGRENILNSTAVILTLIQLGFPVEKIKPVIANFKGAKRRFEKVFLGNNILLFDDYGHHPKEIETTIKAARSRFNRGRIIIIFQPHTYSRTQMLLKEFSKGLSTADFAFILPIFASAREVKSQFKITSDDIVKRSKKNNLYSVKNKTQLIKRLDITLRDGDVVFTMGAGDVYKLKDDLIKVIKKIKNTNQNLKIQKSIKKNINLKRYLSLRMNAAAEYFFEAETREDLIKAKQFSLRNNLPLFILGGGTNLAVISKKLTGLIVKNNYHKKKIIKVSNNSVDLLVSSGYPVSKLIQETVNNGLAGFEYHRGLPGTVGGAIYMNSKWMHPVSYFSDNLLYANIIDKNGNVKKVDKSYFQFSYGYSILQKTKEIILEAVFRLKKASPEILKKRADKIFEHRLKTQPLGMATAGCFFKNINEIEKRKLKLATTSAGYLIEKSGLKGFQIGNFSISKKHANFIINNGEGKASDLLRLLQILKKEVRKKFSVALKEEVIII